MLQLLKDYRTWHTGYGGALPLDETGAKDANYGPAGMIEAGQEFTEGQRARLAKSYEVLDKALAKLRDGTPLQRAAYLVLLAPYLGDPGDPSLVAEWRKNRSDCRPQWHDLAVEELAEYLKDTDLFVIFPKRMTSREEKQVERRNDEFYALYRRLKVEKREGGTPERTADREAIRVAAEMCGYSEPRGYEIIRIREGKTG